VLLVDTGERARDIPFARFDVTPSQELPGALRAAGLDLGATHRDTSRSSASTTTAGT